jgi:hypothetical protein
MYADDTKIFMRVRNIGDCLLLQRDLNSINEWCQRWKLRLNLDKCEIMTGTNRANTLEFAYHMDNVQLERVSHVTDLGIVFESNLSFDMHIDKICKSASRVMGVIRRSCSTDFDAYTVIRLYGGIIGGKKIRFSFIFF